MRTLMLLQHPFPPDIRVENEVLSLLEAGHEVHLLCTGDRRGGEDLPPILDELIVHTLPKAWDDLPIWRRRLTNLPMLWFLNPYWLREIRSLAQEHGGFDVIHVHDLPLVRTARLAARRRCGSSIIADLHENYPMALPFYKRDKALAWFHRFRFSPARWRRYERRSVPACTAVIAVVDEMKSRLEGIGVPADRITVVENYVDVERFLSYRVDGDLQVDLQDRFVITYTGVFGRTRGLDVAVRAMLRVVQAAPDALLLMVGEGPVRDELERLSVELGLAEHVRFEGRVAFERVPSYLGASDVCILPLVKTVQTDAGLAHKLFQYMLLGKPVVASDCDATRRVVTDARCGLLVPPGDSAAFANALLELRDPSLRRELGENGRRAVLDRYNWASAAERLTGLYASIQRPVDPTSVGSET